MGTEANVIHHQLEVVEDGKHGRPLPEQIFKSADAGHRRPTGVIETIVPMPHAPSRGLGAALKISAGQRPGLLDQNL